MNPSPILIAAGVVHSTAQRQVPPYDGRDEVRDVETGAVTQRAIAARAGYDVLDVVLLTTSGGFARVLVMMDALTEGLGGAIPDAGESVEWPVRPFVKWEGQPGRRYNVVGLSLAGDVLAASSKNASRRAPVSAVNG